ncbi:MAG: UvrD-helicase domain-containing protein [Bacilli bacterium]|nr:UvrD-helicase domain-containing protein [Bacilli bacterium]
MPRWTSEQELAISESGKNIIVSAGAGSGKTAVLTERVIRKLKNGISIKNMLILTFTNNAAHEMKERIRKAIKKACIEKDGLKKELDYIDNAYITTFDSFALSIVKKYHYVLDIGNDISIIDSSIVDLKKEEILDEIFEELYKNKDELFLKLVDLLCVKDDKELKNLILSVNSKLDLKEDKIEYLNNYIENYFNDSFINNIVNDYEVLLKDKIKTINSLLDSLSSEVDGKYILDCYKNLECLLKSNNYLEIKNNSCVKLGMLKNSTELGKEIKKEISNIIKDINNMCYYSSDEIYTNLYSVKDYVRSIIYIISKLDKRINEFKKKVNKYEFNDISIMAINIVKNNKQIQEELRDSFHEICVDEYQDTSDLQESFINLISNNNVYMVGDIKQSIYRFRNANPILFKNKYDMYSNLNGGIKIDLVKNFRSRNEVLDDINIIFNLIMDNYIGGAEYIESHNMVFGNTTYINEGKTNQNNNLEIYNYEYDKNYEYKKDEIEAFIIANDIKNKINNKYKVFDKDELILRDIEYKDFVILMDRATNFELYKKIFEYLGIPTTLYKDENIVNENELYLIKNIISLIIKIKLTEFDTEFKYLFTSISRSYLCNYSDNDILNIFNDNSFKDTLLYEKCNLIAKDLDNLSNTQLLNKIIDSFNIFNNFISVGNIENKSMIIDYLYKNFSDLDSIGYGVYELKKYFDDIINKDKQIKISMNEEGNNTVKIMTIHKSKGLEYHICYFSGFDKPFNLSDLKSRIIYDNKYGIIVPFDNEGLDDLITKYIVKDNYIKDDISERIRLLYVALTRAKEKMIIVGNFDKDTDNRLEYNGVIDNRVRSSYRSFKDIILSIKTRLNKYFVSVDLNNIDLSHDYNDIKTFNYENNIENSNYTINVKEIDVEKRIVINKHFSKSDKNVISEKTKNNMDLGTRMHELFEVVDLKMPDYSYLSIEDKNYVDNFLKQDIVKNIKEATIYKEYEFIYQEDDINYHGIIDLMLVYDDRIDIIDYKLKNTTSEEYVKQLNGYKDYIEKLFSKKVNLYLYSIIDDELNKI